MSNFAMVFPGQGSQSVGMLAELSEYFPSVKQTFEIASNNLGYDLWQLIENGPESELNKTWQTQPALLTASVAIYRLWEEQKGKLPTYMAGHSLGEYSALVCSGALDFADAVKLVELRGKLMQEVVPEGTGAMSAIIGLSDDLIAEACQKASQGEIVAPVNFNSPGQVVIAGNKDAVERANALCKESGAKRAVLLPVSVPSHCKLMSPITDRFELALTKIELKQPLIPVINNVDVTIMNDSLGIKDALVRQLSNPVQWSQSVKFMAEQGITKLLEVGPGKVLTGLTKRIDDRLTAQSINDSTSLIAMISELK